MGNIGEVLPEASLVIKMGELVEKIVEAVVDDQEFLRRFVGHEQQVIGVVFLEFLAGGELLSFLLAEVLLDGFSQNPWPLKYEDQRLAYRENWAPILLCFFCLIHVAYHPIIPVFR